MCAAAYVSWSEEFNEVNFHDFWTARRESDIAAVNYLMEHWKHRVRPASHGKESPVVLIFVMICRARARCMVSAMLEQSSCS